MLYRAKPYATIAACFFGALFIFGLLSKARAGTDIDRTLVMRASAGVVQVEVTSVRGRTSLGSGVVVGPGKVVTSCHGTLFAQSLSIVAQGQRFAVRGQAPNIDADLCFLDVPGLSLPVPVRGGSQSIQPGDAVFAFGYARGARSRPMFGDILATHSYRNALVLESTTEFSPGDSGGGLFNAAGELIGLITYIRIDQSGVHRFSIPVEWIDAELARGLRFLPIAPLGELRPFWAREEAHQPFFMRASQYQATERWADLAALAERWQESEPGLEQARSVLHLARQKRRDAQMVLAALPAEPAAASGEFASRAAQGYLRSPR
jgi:hypothetical protein